MARTATTNAVALTYPLLVVTPSVGAASANRVLQDHSAISCALLVGGAPTVPSPVLVLMALVILCLEIALVIEAGRGCYVTRPVPAVVSHAPPVTIAMDHVIKSWGSVSVPQATREVHVWNLVVQVTLVRIVRGSVSVLVEHFVIT